MSLFIYLCIYLFIYLWHGGRIVEKLLNVGLEKPLIGQSLMSYGNLEDSGGLPCGTQKEVWESLKDSAEAFQYFQWRICGSGQLGIACD